MLCTLLASCHMHMHLLIHVKIGILSKAHTPLAFILKLYQMNLQVADYTASSLATSLGMGTPCSFTYTLTPRLRFHPGTKNNNPEPTSATVKALIKVPLQ